MRLLQRNIQTFENFIQNPKDPNKSKAPPIPKKKEIKPIPIEETPEEPEQDIVDEMEQYFEKQKLLRAQWTSIMK
jgi:hypothetical protein